ncbi:MAG: hypothetical protein RIT81_18660 [Deltaproteobacteria bacterium]
MGVFSTCALALALVTQTPVPDVPFEGGFPVTRSDRIFELSDVERGMRGVGYTVFAADVPERFEFEVLGVMQSMLGPGRDVILVKLIGEKIEFTGVISGMSGSPTYLDGKLLGAVAYRFGAFSKEPIAGITPIRSMLDIDDGKEVGPMARLGGLPLHRTVAVSDFRARALPPIPLPDRPATATRDLVPIAAPLAISGLDPRNAQALATRLEGAGFVTIAGAGAPVGGVQDNGPAMAGAVKAAPIAPASPIAALLVRGDINLAAVGTVTMVEKNRVFGFGHPFMGYGHVAFPMATAAVINTLASPAGSYKQAAPARTVGSISHDRLTAIAGNLGDEAPMVPVRVLVQDARKSRATPGFESNFEVVDSPIWLPVMLDNVVASAGGRRLGYEAGGTVDYEAHYQIGEYTLSIEDTISAPSPLRVTSFASRDVATLATIIERNDFEGPKITKIDVRMRTRPEVLLEEIVAVTPSEIDAKPGETVRVVAELRPFRKKTEKVALEITVPKDASGTIDLYVGGGLELDRRDGNARGPMTPESLEDLLGLLANRRPARALYARIYEPALGYRDGTALYLDLPVSQRAALAAELKSGQGKTEETMGPEVHITRPYVVTGGRSVKVTVRR